MYALKNSIKKKCGWLCQVFYFELTQSKSNILGHNLLKKFKKRYFSRKTPIEWKIFQNNFFCLHYLHDEPGGVQI